MKSPEALMVFGGSSGLGQKLALKLSTSTNRVVILSRRKPDWISSLHGFQHVPIDFSCLTQADLNYKIKPFLSLNPSLIFAQRYRKINSTTVNNELEVSMNSIGKILDYIVNLDSKVLNPSKYKVLVVGSTYGQRIGLDQGWEYHSAKAGIESIVRYFAIRHRIHFNLVGVRPCSFRRIETISNINSSGIYSNDQRPTDDQIADSCTNILEIMDDCLNGNIIDLDSCRRFEYNHFN